MALEQILERLIVAVEANTAALTGKSAGGSTKQAAETTSGKGGASAKGADGSVTQDEIKAAAVKVMDKHGKPFAKKLIKDVGGADSLPGVKREKFGALMKAFEKALSASADVEDETDEDEDL